MKIVLCGGGTGGHITPSLSIAHEIKRQNPHCKIVYVADRGGKFAELTANQTEIDEVKTIYAGKFRRYHGEPWLTRLKDYKTNLLNIRDFFRVNAGIVQSFFWLGKAKPNVIFLNGGFVSLPVGLAAAVRKIPYITHDWDAIASLANKMVGKWAVFNATGMPSDNYSYSKHKIRFVGIPVAKEYQPVDLNARNEFRKAIGVPENAKMILITGGSLGAVKLNKILIEIIEPLLKTFGDLYIFHQVGKGNTKIYDGLKPDKRLRVVEFIPDMYKYSGAADLVIARAGATSIAELAVQGKPTIFIPNPFLTGGQQSKNAEQLELRELLSCCLKKIWQNNPNYSRKPLLIC